MRRFIREVAKFACCVGTAWVCTGTGVLRADDERVAPASQGTSTPASDAPRSSLRHWQMPDAERPPGVKLTRARPDYTGWLIGSYLAFPVLVYGVPMLVSRTTEDDSPTAIALLGGEIAALILPALVHFTNDDAGRALRAFGLNLLFVSVGVVAGAFVGGALTTDQAKAETDGDAAIVNAIGGAFIGGSIGATGWALIDVIETASSVGEREPVSSRDGLRFALLPHTSGMFANVSGAF